jgi:hypothetical protein
VKLNSNKTKDEIQAKALELSDKLNGILSVSETNIKEKIKE